MPTNEERSEVAARLRQYIDFDFEDSNPYWYVMKAIYGDVAIHGDNELFARLADLIEPEERTCRIKQHRCTNCDYEINDRAYFVKVELDGGAWTAYSRTANFCPNCGARVKEDTDA